jgi:hypothetical protein
MSDYKAIMGVSATLQRLLLDRMDYRKNGNKIPVTIAPADVKVSNVPDPRVNIFLYRITENIHLKNQEITGRGSVGDYGHPPLSLDLHYILTAYGESEEDDLEAHIILGDAMRVLHDHSLITEKLLKIHASLPGESVLDTSLIGQFERIKIYLDPISLEDLTKIWTAFIKPYRSSVAYRVNVVQIESQLPRSLPRLVGEPPSKGPKVYAVPFRRPQIDEVRVIRQGDATRLERQIPYASIGDTLIVSGYNLVTGSTCLILSSLKIPALTGSDNRMEVIIPDDLGLRPGPQILKVVQEVMMGDPPELHGGFRSNTAVFMLVPKIEKLLPTFLPAKRSLQVTGSRLFDPKMECMTLIGDTVIPMSVYTTKEPKEIEFDLPSALGKGEYAVRVRVNGVESIEDKTLVVP